MNLKHFNTVLTFLMIFAFIGPLIYGLYVYNWNLNTFLGLNNLQKKLDLDVEISYIYLDKGEVIVKLTLINTGDIPLNITKIDSILTLSSKEFNVKLDSSVSFPKPIVIDVQGKRMLELRFKTVYTPAGVNIPLSGTYELQLTIEDVILSNPLQIHKSLSGTYSFR